ncbi:MAG TPA: extracellular solute-binding protein [Acidimicrobiales bacterium]|nr:extracellular solute-binding protein [Acidimicrobiales bacterium]
MGAAAATAMLAATLLVSAPAQASSKVTLTLWQNYGTEQNAVATKNLIAAFEKANPNITIKDVAQPGTNYFQLLQASQISGNGPDLAVMWTGVFDLQYQNLLVNLKGNVPAADLARMQNLQWTAPNFKAANGPLVMPLETQFYIGFYNKSLFKKAGITSVPTDWSQLYADAAKLKAKGILPMVYGNGGQAISTEFYPWYDMSYLMIGAHSLASWKGLYDGAIPWTAKANVAQLKKWAELEKRGYTNNDVLTRTNNLQTFESGKAAMLVDGTWDTAQYTSKMGSNVAAFVPPFSNTPIKGVVDYPGDGFSVLKSSKNKAAAFKFIDFLTTKEAGNIINRAGLIPDIKGMTTSNPVNQEMLNFVTKDHMTPYPMMDNYVQVNVGNAADKVLPAVLANQQSPLSALQNMEQAWKQLPPAQRSSTSFAGG